MKTILVFWLLNVKFISARVIQHLHIEYNEINIVFKVPYPILLNSNELIRTPRSRIKQFPYDIGPNSEPVPLDIRLMPSYIPRNVETTTFPESVHISSFPSLEDSIVNSRRSSTPGNKPGLTEAPSQPPNKQSCCDSSEEIFTPTQHPNWKLVNDKSCGQNYENRIVGGKNASLGQFPWIARIGYANEFEKRITYKCGGVLITEKHVLTAAHCVTSLPTGFKIIEVQLGEYDTTKKIDCVADECADPPQNIRVKNVNAHEQYESSIFENDIGLLTLEKIAKFSNWVSPICLPFGSLLTKNLTGSIVDIAGWGFYDTMLANQSIILQTVKLPVLNPDSCRKKFKRYKINSKKQLCVGGEMGKDSCSGDSGGPLMKVEVEDDGPKFYLFGIVSFGAIYCGLNSNPAVYTNLVHYLKWILDQLGD